MANQAIPLVVVFKGGDATTFAAIDYNEKAVAERGAYRAALHNFGKIEQKDIHSARVMKRYLQKIADKNGGVKCPQKHIILSYPGKASPEETEKIVKQAHQMMDLLGYAGQPQAIYVHTDTNQTHVHCVTCTIDRTTGLKINDSYEGARANHIINSLRGVRHAEVLDRLTDYRYESRQQLMNLLWHNGYKYAYINEETGKLIVPPFHYSKALDLSDMEIALSDIDRRIMECGKNKDNFPDRTKQLRQILLKYRRESLDYVVNTPPDKVDTRYGGKHTTTELLNQVLYGKFKGSKYLDMNDLRKEQLKILLVKLKRELGLQIVFNEWKDGQVKGYTVVDHSKGIVWKGSDILNLQQFLNPDWRRGQENDAVISAKSAAEAAQELAPNPNLIADKIAAILDPLGVDYTIKAIPEEYLEHNTYEDNARMATEYAYSACFLNGQQAEECARRAYAYACAADLQESMKKAGGQKPSQSHPERPTVTTGEQVKTAGPDIHNGNQDKEQPKEEPRRETKDDARKDSPVSDQQEPEQPLPFVDIHAEVRDGKIIARIDDTEHTADILILHQAWYDSQEDKRQAANTLAMHYFPDSIYEAQIYNYRKFFIDRYEMPQGIELKDPYVSEDKDTHESFLHSWFVYPDGYNTKKSQSEFLPKELTIAYRHSKYTPKQLAVKHLGMNALKEKEAKPLSFSQVKQQDPSVTNSPFETQEAISDTAKVFEGIAETMTSMVYATFGLIIGAGASPSVGAGGSPVNNNGWRGKKDPDDLAHYDLFPRNKRSRGLKR